MSLKFLRDEFEELRSIFSDWTDGEIYDEIMDRSEADQYNRQIKRWLRCWAIYKGYFKPISDYDRHHTYTTGPVTWFKLDGCYYDYNLDHKWPDTITTLDELEQRRIAGKDNA